MHNLGDPFRGFVRETYLLAGYVEELQISGQSCTTLHRYAREMCVVRLHDAWSRFCRELVILSANGAKTLDGLTIAPSPGINSIADALQIVKTQAGWEPRWADENACVVAAQKLQVSNMLSITRGVGAPFSPVEQLRRVRNFVAHRHHTTAMPMSAIAQTLRLPRISTPDEIVTSVIPPGLTVFASWTRRMQQMAELAVTA